MGILNTSQSYPPERVMFTRKCHKNTWKEKPQGIHSVKLTAILDLKIGPNCPKRQRVEFQPFIFNVNSLFVSGRVVNGWGTWRFPKKQRERCRKFLYWNLLDCFSPITFPFMEIKAITKNYTPPFHDNKKTNGWIFLNGRGKTSEPHHQSFGLFKIFVFPVKELAWGVRSVLDLASGTYRKLIFKRMPGLGRRWNDHLWAPSLFSIESRHP